MQAVPETLSAPSAPPSKRLVLGSVGTLLLLAALEQSIVATALPTIVAQLGGLDHLSWVVTGYILASTVAAPLYGKMGDLYGRRTMVFVSVGLFLLGSALCGAAWSMPALIAFRALQGLGGGGLMVLALSIVADVVPLRERGRVQALFATIFATSSVVGPLLGGWFVEAASWRWIFYLNLPLGALAVAGFALSFRPTGIRVARRIDYAGAAALSAALGTLVLVTSLGGRTLAWDAPAMLALIGLAATALPAFLWIEARAEEPILPLGLFRINTFWVTCAVGFAAGAALFGTVTFLPIFLQIARGASPTMSGLMMIPMMAGILLASNGSGRVMRSTGRHKSLLVLGTVLMTLGMLALSTMPAEVAMWRFGASLLLTGAGIGCIFPVTITAIQNAVPREQMGVATASGLMFRQIGGSLAVALFGTIFAARMAERLGDLPGLASGEIGPQMLSGLAAADRGRVVEAVTQGMHPIFLAAAVIAVAGTGLALMLREVPLRLGDAAAS